MEKSNFDWIVCCQEAEVLKKFSGPVVWVNQCLRCGQEEPVFTGPVPVRSTRASYLSKCTDTVRHDDTAMVGIQEEPMDTRDGRIVPEKNVRLLGRDDRRFFKQMGLKPTE